MEQAIFTTLCMVSDPIGRVLVQERVGTAWDGIAFPGGHVEPGESFVEAAAREVFEETGYRLKSLTLCGICAAVPQAAMEKSDIVLKISVISRLMAVHLVFSGASLKSIVSDLCAAALNCKERFPVSEVPIGFSVYTERKAAVSCEIPLPSFQNTDTIENSSALLFSRLPVAATAKLQIM